MLYTGYGGGKLCEDNIVSSKMVSPYTDHLLDGGRSQVHSISFMVMPTCTLLGYAVDILVEKRRFLAGCCVLYYNTIMCYCQQAGSSTNELLPIRFMVWSGAICVTSHGLMEYFTNISKSRWTASHA